jgi:hypothetical protein
MRCAILSFGIIGPSVCEDEAERALTVSAERYKMMQETSWPTSGNFVTWQCGFNKMWPLFTMHE